jgi:hypothetical protein
MDLDVLRLFASVLTSEPVQQDRQNWFAEEPFSRRGPGSVLVMLAPWVCRHPSHRHYREKLSSVALRTSE